VVVIDVVMADLFILVMYVHILHHRHAPPFMYENPTTHPHHLTMHVDVCTLIVTSSCGDLLLSHFIYYNCSFLFFFCDELVSFCGLQRMCLITTSKVITQYGFGPPFINF
jgi:hypothetical protein